MVGWWLGWIDAAAAAGMSFMLTYFLLNNTFAYGIRGDLWDEHLVCVFDFLLLEFQEWNTVDYPKEPGEKFFRPE